MRISRFRAAFDLGDTRFAVPRRLAIALFALLTFTPIALAQGTPPTVSLSFDFRNGSLGWTAGFADYPPATDQNGFYELLAEMRSLPPELGVNGTGFFIQGANHSDDLLMFMKRHLSSADGIVAGQSYQVTFTITFDSVAQSGCIGIGGSPGDGVFLRAGGAPAEPLALLDKSLPSSYARMNLAFGKRQRDAIAGSSMGSIANGIPCDSAPKSYVSIQRTHQHTSLINANSSGDLWLLVGIDSGYEGLTAVYFQRIDVTLTPVGPPPAPVLLTDPSNGRAAAVDSVTLLREPFSIASPQNFFSPDQHTRVTLFGYYLELKNGEGLSAITAQAEDSQHRLYTLPVEAVRDVPDFGWIKGVTVRLPDELQGVGDVSVKLGLRGVASNAALISIK